MFHKNCEKTLYKNVNGQVAVKQRILHYKLVFWSQRDSLPNIYIYLKIKSNILYTSI